MTKQKKEEIEYLKEEINELQKRKDALEGHECYDEYDEMINETSDTVKIGILEYDPATVLKEVDETAYNCGYNDWIDAEVCELEDSIEEKQAEIRELEED